MLGLKVEKAQLEIFERVKMNENIIIKPEVFQTVLSGEKIYEHRRVFPDGPVKAYIYISRPVQALDGILYLGNKVNIIDWKEKYKDDMDA